MLEFKLRESPALDGRYVPTPAQGPQAGFLGETDPPADRLKDYPRAVTRDAVC